MLPADSTVPYWLQTAAAAQALAYTVLERYPAAFCVDPAGVRPLQVGIHREMALALDVPREVVRAMRRRETRRHASRAACLVPGALRVDLHGQAVAPVAPGQAAAARRAGGGAGACRPWPRDLTPGWTAGKIRPAHHRACERREAYDTGAARPRHGRDGRAEERGVSLLRGVRRVRGQR